MNVHYLVFRPDSLTYTIAKALSFGGHPVRVWVTDPEHGRRSADGLTQKLAATPGIEIASGDENAWPPASDRLLVQVFPRLLEHSQAFDPLAARAQRITLITAGDRSRPRRQALQLQWRELRRFARRLGKIDRVAYKDGFYPLDLYAPLKPRRVVGFDVHSQFLHDHEAFQAIHAIDWNAESPRPILANFLGSRDPAIRRQVVDRVRPFFQASDSQSGPAGKSWFWHEYSDAAPAGLGQREFLDVLSRSDFTLCPPGYSRITHRPLEALLRGSIPVLNADELDLYAIGLRDGVNCIGVPAGHWPAAMEKIARLEEAEILRMRRNIRELREHQLGYDVVSKQMRIRLGIQDG